MKKSFALILVFAFVLTLFVPTAAVFAESENLLITDAQDNGGTQSYSQARAAIPNLRKDGDLWYSAKRPDCDPSGSAVAIFRLGQAATVEGVSIAFYKADEREQSFSVDYSVDGENWNVALALTKSSEQQSYVEGSEEAGYADGVHPAETFSFPTPVYAKFLRVTLTATKTGFWHLFNNEYSAFHTFEAFGVYDPNAEPDSANYDAIYEAMDNMIRGVYDTVYWDSLQSAFENVPYELNCFEQSTVDAAAQAIFNVIDDPSAQVAEVELQYHALRGAVSDGDESHGPGAALDDTDAFCSVSGNEEYEQPEVIYFLPRETELDHIILDWHAPDDRSYCFTISVSVDDGHTWTTVYDNVEESVFEGDSTFEYPLDQVHATHIRLTGISNSGNENAAAEFRRFRLFGDPVEGGVVPTLSCDADLPAFDHDYVAVVTPVTCTEPGYTTYTCSFCGDTYVGDRLDALGHDYVAAVTAPTCTEQGYTTYTCSHCGDFYVTDYVDALDHNYYVSTIEPTCTEQGYTGHLCLRCFDYYFTDYVDPLDHTGGTATCTHKAVCERCHEEYGELDPENHEDCTDLPWESDDVRHWKVCGCGVIVLLANHEYDGADATECALCGHARAVSVLYGDLNGDGTVELADLTMLAKAVSGWTMDADYRAANADCNGDGTVELADVVLLAKFIAGWSVVLGPAE